MNQDEIELKVFRKFAVSCRYDIDSSSIKKNNPPSPDIFCTLLDNTCIDFELAECIDSTMAKKNNAANSLRKYFKQKVDELPSRLGHKLSSDFNDALIYTDFRDDISKKAKISAIPEIINYILSLGVKAKGDIFFKDKKYKRISIYRNHPYGPVFKVTDAGSYADPIIEVIESKIQKKI